MPATDGSTGGRREIRRARPLLGTLVEVGITSPLPADAVHHAIDAAFQAIARIHALMSRQDPHSELSRLNRCAALAAQAIDPHTATVLGTALRLAQMSNGAFDPAACHARGPVAVASSCWRDVELHDDGTVSYRRPLELDLGGIAKGYAVDQATQVLLAHGCTEFIVNAGGDLRVGGEHTVRLRHPAQPQAAAESLLLRDQAMATSAAYFSQHHGTGDLVHLVDPGSGAPYHGPASISVLAGDCMRADALTKIVLFAPRACAEQILRLEHAQAIILDPAIAA